MQKGTMRGCGTSTIPTIFTFVGICLLRLVWIFAYVPFNPTLKSIYACYPITWAITSIMFWIYYLKGNWLRLSKIPH
ncbi:MAG: hypothetical protein GX220_08350 [Treponema sp.]|nr:hypothetical protein [Treponema sp.]